MFSQLFSMQGLAVAGLGLCIAWLVNRYVENKRIKKYGGYAAAYGSFMPLALDFIWVAVREIQRHRSYEFWSGMFHKYGNRVNPYTIEVNVVGRRHIFTADPENIKAILATQFSDYGKGERFNKEWHPFLGDSIFTTDGQKWQDSRHLLRPQFIKTRLSDLHVFEKHTSMLTPMLGGQGEAVNIADLFQRFTLDTATDFLLGHSVDSLTKSQVAFAAAFGEVQRVQGLMSIVGPLIHLVPKSTYRAGIKVIDQFVNPFIDRALDLSPEELEKRTRSEEGYTFLHAIAGYTRDRSVLRDQLVAVLLAGRDTTAATLAWTIYELSKQPRIVRKLRCEIEDVVGLHNAPTYTHLKSMKYLQHILNETLRLYPIVPHNVRLALKDCTLPRGAGPNGDEPVGVLAGTPIGYSTLVMQRRSDLYPPPSTGFPPILDFVPERWDHWIPPSWTYIPFNGGPRICIGQQFALTEMAYTLVRIFQRFSRLEDRSGGVHPGLRTDIVLQPASPVNVAFWV